MPCHRRFGLVLGALSACLVGAEPAQVRLAGPAHGSLWIAWNEAGRYTLDLPAGWSYEVPESCVARLLFVGGETATLEPETRLEAESALRLQCRARALRGEIDGHLTVVADADRLEFGPGAVFLSRHASFGNEGRAEVSALAIDGAPPLEFRFERDFAVAAETIEWRSGGDPVPLVLCQLPGFGAVETGSLSRLGLWSPTGLQLDWKRQDGLSLLADDVAWANVNGLTPSRARVVAELPRAALVLRRASFASPPPLKRRARLREVAGGLAEQVVLRIDGEPGLARFGAADTPLGLEAALDELARRRGEGGSGLVHSIRARLLPAWFGLWYDADAGAEVTRETATLARFTALYSQATAEARPRLVSWLSGQPSRAGVTLAAPEALAGALAELVTALSADDARQRAFLSVYLSDLLTAAAGAPVSYDFPDQLYGSAPQAAQVDLPALRELLAHQAATPLQSHLDAALTAPEVVEEVSFERLGPGFAQPVDLRLEIDRHTPVGRHRFDLVVLVGGAEMRREPLEIEVQRSWFELFEIGLVVGLPALLLAFIGTRLAQARPRPADDDA